MVWFVGVIEAIISGVVQGITEFLPISSSGHLVILHHLIGFKEPEVLFDIFLHIGTLFSIIFVFWQDILGLFNKWRMLSQIFIATVVTVAVVLLFKNSIESAFKDLRFIGWMLLITGMWLFSGSIFDKRIKTKNPLNLFKSAVIGLSQGIAAFPGISRSGSTISTGLILGLKQEETARFSFLLSIPAIILASIYKVTSSGAILGGISFLNAFFGLITSFIVGILSLKLLLKIVYKGKLHWFGIYCLVVGMALLLSK